MNFWEATSLTLDCYPSVPGHVALPWDAADEYLIRKLEPKGRQLLINDRHGVLACIYPDAQMWVDSACSIKAIHINRNANSILCPADIICHEKEIDPDITQVVIKIPKSFELLCFWLYWCAHYLPDNTEYYLAGMAKHIPVNWLNWLEKHSNDYQQYPVLKKSRLVRIVKPEVKPVSTAGYTTPSGLKLHSLPGVFSRHNLDSGSKVLLQHMGFSFHGKVCDLGCGNGLLGLIIKQKYPKCQLLLTDDSYLAIRSAQENAIKNKLTADVRHGHLFDSVSGKVDWVVCNPPFHDGHKKMTNIAHQMFQQSRSRLTFGGKLIVVANRHLPYLKYLKNLFQKVNLISRDSRFNVYLCEG